MVWYDPFIDKLGKKCFQLKGIGRNRQPSSKINAHWTHTHIHIHTSIDLDIQYDNRDNVNTIVNLIHPLHHKLSDLS